MKSQNCIAAKYAVAIEVSKTASEVYNHLVNDVPNFWPEEFEGQSSKPNDEFVFRSGDGHYSKNKVVELVPGKRLVWLVTESIRKTDNFEWTGTKMIFELTPKDNHTLLQFTYDGVVLEDEYDRLVQICDTVIERNLYNLLTGNSYTAVIKSQNRQLMFLIPSKKFPNGGTRKILTVTAQSSMMSLSFAIPAAIIQNRSWWKLYPARE